MMMAAYLKAKGRRILVALFDSSATESIVRGFKTDQFGMEHEDPLVIVPWKPFEEANAYSSALSLAEMDRENCEARGGEPSKWLEMLLLMLAGDDDYITHPIYREIVDEWLAREALRDGSDADFCLPPRRSDKE